MPALKKGYLTATRINQTISKGYLVQTSIKLHKLYPDKEHAFHSILIYKVEGDKVFYHDPAHGEALRCTMKELIKASNNVGAVVIYCGLD